MNITRPQREVAGRVRVTGHVRGYVQGEIDADIQGTFQGQMKVSVDSVIPGRQGQIEQNDLDSQQISEDDDIATIKHRKEMRSHDNEKIFKEKDNTGRTFSILIIMTVISIMPINVSAEDSLNVIEISRVNELIEFANKCKYDSYSKDKIVKLTADIDVSGSDFKGISYFAGTFDGGSHIISGFNVDYKGSDFGFFRYIAESGFITNLNISGSINVTGVRKI